jgi:hypothetical protein
LKQNGFMATKKISTLEKINQTELRIKELVKQRNKELLDIITRFNAISIDNNLLSGFIIFALNPDNKDHPILKEFKELGQRPKLPSKSK